MTRKTHVITPSDRARVGCSHPAHDERTGGVAVMVEHVPHAGGVSFFRYCADCWYLPAANGGPSAAERTGVDLPDALDFERRWLAECRAHGETKRELEQLRCTLTPEQLEELWARISKDMITDAHMAPAPPIVGSDLKGIKFR